MPHHKPDVVVCRETKGAGSGHTFEKGEEYDSFPKTGRNPRTGKDFRYYLVGKNRQWLVHVSEKKFKKCFTAKAESPVSA